MALKSSGKLALSLNSGISMVAMKDPDISSVDINSNTRSIDRILNNFKGGQDVRLFYEGLDVGKGIIQQGVRNPTCPEKSIHGTPLQDYESVGKDLVCIYNFSISKGTDSSLYKYKFGRIESIPVPLGDIGANFVA